MKLSMAKGCPLMSELGRRLSGPDLEDGLWG